MYRPQFSPAACIMSARHAYRCTPIHSPTARIVLLCRENTCTNQTSMPIAHDAKCIADSPYVPPARHGPRSTSTMCNEAPGGAALSSYTGTPCTAYQHMMACVTPACTSRIHRMRRAPVSRADCLMNGWLARSSMTQVAAISKPAFTPRLTAS